MLGVFDYEVNHEIINIQQVPNEFTKTREGEFATKAMYQNFLLSEKNYQYKRITYTFLDVLGYVGGILEIGGLFICFLIVPFKYNLTKVRMMMDYLP